MCHQSPKHYIEIWHERPFSLQSRITGGSSPSSPGALTAIGLLYSAPSPDRARAHTAAHTQSAQDRSAAPDPSQRPTGGPHKLEEGRSRRLAGPERQLEKEGGRKRKEEGKEGKWAASPAVPTWAEPSAKTSRPVKPLPQPAQDTEPRSRPSRAELLGRAEPA